MIDYAKPIRTGLPWRKVGATRWSVFDRHDRIERLLDRAQFVRLRHNNILTKVGKGD